MSPAWRLGALPALWCAGCVTVPTVTTDDLAVSWYFTESSGTDQTASHRIHLMVVNRSAQERVIDHVVVNPRGQHHSWRPSDGRRLLPGETRIYALENKPCEVPLWLEVHLA